jgi:hypothetical protein
MDLKKIGYSNVDSVHQVQARKDTVGGTYENFKET